MTETAIRQETPDSADNHNSPGNRAYVYFSSVFLRTSSFYFRGLYVVNVDEIKSPSVFNKGLNILIYHQTGLISSSNSEGHSKKTS